MRPLRVSVGVNAMDWGGATVTTAGAAADPAEADVLAGEHPVPNRATKSRGRTVAATHRRFEIMENRRSITGEA
jgi:glycerate-2-kinase